jgi:hypothetical protein
MGCRTSNAGTKASCTGTVAGRFLTQQVMPAKNEIAGLFETKEVGFELRDHVGFRYDIFEKNVASNVGKTWSPENGYQFTTTSIMFQRQYRPGGCAIFSFSQQHLSNVSNESGTSCPVLSGDSDLLGSIERTRYSISERTVEISPTLGDRLLTVDISKVGPGFVVIESLLGEFRSLLVKRQSSMLLDVKARDLESNGFSHEYSVLTFDGQVAWRLPRTGRPEDGRIIVIPPDWVWWQAEGTRETSCCIVEWSVDGRTHTHRVARGREIVSVSLQPTSKLIAVSVTDKHRTGRVPDAVYVFSAEDGVEFIPPISPADHAIAGPVPGSQVPCLH